MKCPTCTDTKLVMTDRQGIEIDYCPDCRGVWLDRGELDKIIERSAGTSSMPQPVTPTPSMSQPMPQPVPQPTVIIRRDDDWDDDDDDHKKIKYDKYGRPYKKSKTKSLLGEIFDF